MTFPSVPLFRFAPWPARFAVPGRFAMLATLATLATLACTVAAIPPARAQRATSTTLKSAPVRAAVQWGRALDAYPGALALGREWAPDAALVYAENADTLARDGTSRAWSFVFASAEAREARGVTMRALGKGESFDLPFPFDPPAIEAGWLDISAALALQEKDAAITAVRAAGFPGAAVLSRGLLTPRGESRTSWLVTYPALSGSPGQELVLDALKGSLLARRALTPVTDASRSRGGLPAQLASQRARILARLEELRDDPSRVSTERARGLTAREADASQRLAAQDEARDTLGRGGVVARGAEVEKNLAGLAAWRVRMAETDSALERAAGRVAAAERDLAAERPTELALFVSGEQRARPARIGIFVDGAEIARAAWGEAEWKALDAGAWAEVVRAALRPGMHEVRLEVESPDRRVTTTSWRGTLAEGRLSLLRVRLRGGAGSGSPEPTFEFVAARQL